MPKSLTLQIVYNAYTIHSVSSCYKKNQFRISCKILLKVRKSDMQNLAHIMYNNIFLDIILIPSVIWTFFLDST